MPMARSEVCEEPLPVESNTPSIINMKPTKVNPYGTPRTTPLHRFGITPRIEGRLLALFGSFVTGLNMTAIKYLYGDSFPAPEALITRYTPSLLFVLLIGLYIKHIRHNTEWSFFARDASAFKTLSIRAFFHWCSNMTMVYSLLFVPVMITIALFYIWSIFAIILSYCFLNEAANLSDVLLSLIGFGGVIMITDPKFQSFSTLTTQHIEGIILIIVSALFYSMNMVILRKKRKTYHWTQTESVAGLWATFIFTPAYILLCYYVFDVPLNALINFDLSLTEWLLFTAISIFAFVAIGGITRALQLETIIIVSIVLYSEVAFGTIFQFVFLHDTTNFDTYGLWIGLFCVLISTFCIMYRKQRLEERKICRFDSISIATKHVAHNRLKNGKNETLNLLEHHAVIDHCESYGALDPVKT